MDGNNNKGRIEPVFGLKTPLLFAHRGGVLEAPESTVEAFNHAKTEARAEVLELDIQLSADGEFVVWHGPELDNVLIDGEETRPSRREWDRRKVYHFNWEKLKNAWVAPPEWMEGDIDQVDLKDIPTPDERRLLLLSDFLEEFPDMPLNIEMKKSFRRKINDADRKGLRDNIRAFKAILDDDPGDRKIVVVSAIDDYIDEFRTLDEGKYVTGLSIKEQLVLRFLGLDMKDRVLETSYHEFISSETLIEKVRDAGSSTFVFLTRFSFLLPAIDDVVREEKVMEVLNRGVDGIMTDRPGEVRKIIDKWKST
jgi:glycerophosphoryl diester phosphodiesterase